MRTGIFFPVKHQLIFFNLDALRVKIRRIKRRIECRCNCWCYLCSNHFFGYGCVDCVYLLCVQARRKKTLKFSQNKSKSTIIERQRVLLGTNKINLFLQINNSNNLAKKHNIKNIEFAENLTLITM